MILSSSEADFDAMAKGFKNAVFSRYLSSVTFPGSDVWCATVFEDNPGALHLANSSSTTRDYKHVPVDFAATSVRGVSRKGSFGSCTVGLAEHGLSHQD